MEAKRINKPEAKGWGLPLNSNRWHYFDGATSLCGKWIYGGHLEVGNDDSPDNCSACRKKLAATNT